MGKVFAIICDDFFLLYLSAKCQVHQVSGQFAGNTAESHTGEHADAGIHLLRSLQILVLTNMQQVENKYS